mgnify:CR=1 FL=1
MSFTSKSDDEIIKLANPIWSNLIRSSNIGAVRIAQKVGIEKYKNFLNSLGLLNEISFDLDEAIVISFV